MTEFFIHQLGNSFNTLDQTNAQMGQLFSFDHYLVVYIPGINRNQGALLCMYDFQPIPFLYQYQTSSWVELSDGLFSFAQWSPDEEYTRIEVRGYLIVRLVKDLYGNERTIECFQLPFFDSIDTHDFTKDLVPFHYTYKNIPKYIRTNYIQEINHFSNENVFNDIPLQKNNQPLRHIVTLFDTNDIPDTYILGDTIIQSLQVTDIRDEFSLSTINTQALFSNFPAIGGDTLFPYDHLFSLNESSVVLQGNTSLHIETDQLTFHSLEPIALFSSANERIVKFNSAELTIRNEFNPLVLLVTENQMEFEYAYMTPFIQPYQEWNIIRGKTNWHSVPQNEFIHSMPMVNTNHIEFLQKVDNQFTLANTLIGSSIVLEQTSILSENGTIQWTIPIVADVSFQSTVANEILVSSDIPFNDKSKEIDNLIKTTPDPIGSYIESIEPNVSFVFGENELNIASTIQTDTLTFNDGRIETIETSNDQIAYSFLNYTNIDIKYNPNTSQYIRIQQTNDRFTVYRIEKNEETLWFTIAIVEYQFKAYLLDYQRIALVLFAPTIPSSSDDNLNVILFEVDPFYQDYRVIVPHPDIDNEIQVLREWTQDIRGFRPSQLSENSFSKTFLNETSIINCMETSRCRFAKNTLYVSFPEFELTNGFSGNGFIFVIVLQNTYELKSIVKDDRQNIKEGTYLNMSNNGEILCWYRNGLNELIVYDTISDIANTINQIIITPDLKLSNQYILYQDNTGNKKITYDIGTVNEERTIILGTPTEYQFPLNTTFLSDTGDTYYISSSSFILNEDQSIRQTMQYPISNVLGIFNNGHHIVSIFNPNDTLESSKPFQEEFSTYDNAIDAMYIIEPNPEMYLQFKHSSNKTLINSVFSSGSVCMLDVIGRHIDPVDYQIGYISKEKWNSNTYHSVPSSSKMIYIAENSTNYISWDKFKMGTLISSHNREFVIHKQNQPILHMSSVIQLLNTSTDTGHSIYGDLYYTQLSNISDKNQKTNIVEYNKNSMLSQSLDIYEYNYNGQTHKKNGLMASNETKNVDYSALGYKLLVHLR